MKRAYYEDVQLVKSGVVVFWMAVLLVTLLVFPFVAESYTLYIVNYAAVNVLIAVGLNILVGYTGQISLGHAGFVAVGAYATVLMMMHLSLPFLLALVTAGFIAAGFGHLLGMPALRLEGPYLAIATLGFGLAVTQVIGRWSFFGGRMGLMVPELALGSIDLSSDRALYFVIMPVVVLLTLGARNLMRSRVGRAFQAIRDSDIAAQTLGVDVAYYKKLSFAVSAFYAGVAGGLMAFVTGYINPDQFTFLLSVLLLAMVTVGGLGTILGGVLGGAVVSVLLLKSDVIQALPLIGPALEAVSAQLGMTGGIPNVSWIFSGLVLILVVVLEPLGLCGLWRRIQRYWSTWPF